LPLQGCFKATGDLIQCKSKMMQKIYLDEVPSTNNYATGILQTEALQEGTVVLTFRQTCGRGQAQNVWESEDYKNLTFSLVLRPDFLPASSQFALSQVISLGLADYLSAETDDVAIKWPNDILVGKAKVAGMLVENSVMGSTIGWTVAGIGLNLNQKTFREYQPPAVSLSQVTGKFYHPEEVLNEVFKSIMNRYGQLKKGRTGEISRDYLTHLFGMEQWLDYFTKDINLGQRTHTGRKLGSDQGETDVAYEKQSSSSNEKTFKARIIGTDEFGRLMLEDRQGNITVWSFKTIRMKESC
jgi:BirA family transcriptional regulator, biotin operon repressor / biotin---[acetyl-CoA-carboxylase] ligase